jgi:hypothetical protein
MIALRLTLLATAAFAAPAADADADPQFLLGHHGLGYGHGLAYAHVVAAPVCKVVTETVTLGQRCHAEPDCTTETVVVGRHVTGVEEPTCTDVEHVVPAVVPHAYYGKREAEADPQLLLGAAPYLAHATTKVTTKHCVPGAPILEDVTTDVTKCVPKSVCEDVTAEVLKTVCGDAAAPEEAVEEA